MKIRYYNASAAALVMPRGAFATTGASRKQALLPRMRQPSLK